MLDSLLSRKTTSLDGDIERIEEQLNGVILGKSNEIKLALCCLIAGGHLLIEDYPGLGKTTLAQALAKTLGLDSSRIQFTSDMLPADVIGISVYDTATQKFAFHKGPVFKSVVLADEINRASPKAQSALLEAMAERSVSVDGCSYPLPEPFFVIATQNPHDQSGTFPLPESQLDRFMMTLSLGYPNRQSEIALLKGLDRRQIIRDLTAVVPNSWVVQMQSLAEAVHVSNDLAEYIVDIITASRSLDWACEGLSPRGGLSLLRSAKAWAALDRRDVVIPEDVQNVMPAVTGHRLIHNPDPSERANCAKKLIQSISLG